ncbi:hypothetical protein AKJ38_00280 [candidate division MSBL1 archaeon SCGC-AAA259I14]|uniref:4Fe-4S ferredoxin-type domain-containing protein n=1 Tax=candidate division MSBL1 archaeon SCGC-AAA259I14 TaxID=1698268 RepID=A0A133UU98_9EURY|nr:hypothetical protein AKJ38_00280 [candidate division MSBL1 archaeon SCGC-AAA259I14]
MLITDDANCVGCKTCEMICSIHHENVNNPKKARIAIRGEYEKGFQISGCVRCGICHEICPENAIFVTDDHYYQINRDKCTNCEECVEECPQNCILTHTDFDTPVGICDFCGDCVEECPVNVLQIGGL